VEEEFIEEHFRKLRITDGSSRVVKVDVFCKPRGFNRLEEDPVYVSVLGGRQVSVFRVSLGEGVEGIVICVEDDCKLVDLILFGSNSIDLHGVCGDEE